MKNSGLLHLIAVLILIGAAAYAWPDVLTAIQKGAYEGAKAGAQAAVTEVINKALPNWAR